jgi:hypothetical protein
VERERFLSNSLIFDNGTYVGIGTSTPVFGLVTIGTSTAPQLVLHDNSTTNNSWTLRSIAGTFYVATSTYTATSSDRCIFDLRHH